MREFFREIVHALEEGRPVELVSIAASDGSTPRGAGAMMAVFPGGGITGTIGGGNVEFECQRLAAELLERGGDALRQFRFTLGDAASLGMVCGGGVTVQFQYLPAGEQRIIAVLRDLIEADGGNRDTWLLRRIEGEQVTAMGLADRTGPRHLDILPEELELLCGNQAVFARKWLSIPVVKAGPISSAADMCLRPWCRCWLPWASAPWCTTTGRSSRTRRCSPKQKRPSAGTSPGCPNR